jgi:mannose-6-phosphate isomerase-like protein (cupin superfamily)
MHKIDFMLVEWAILADGAREKIWSDGERRVRLLELDERFVEQEWCQKAHVGMVLAGVLEMNFNGVIERFATGHGLTIKPGDSHKARAVEGIVRLVMFEEE